MQHTHRLNADLDAGNLNLAIDLLENLIKVYPLEPFLLDNLGLALRTRSEFSGSRDDLERAISYHTKTRDLRRLDSFDYPISLDNLACALHDRFNVMSDPDDLDEAVSLHRKALALRPFGHPDRSSFLSNLSKALSIRFDQSGRMGDLEDAISSHHEAIALRPPGHQARSSSLSNLAKVLCTRFDQLGRMEDLEDAILSYREALAFLPLGHTDCSSSLSNLASALCTRFEHSGGMQDLEESFILYERAANDLSSSLQHRLAAGIVWINKARLYHHSSTIRAYSTSLHLLNHCLIACPNVELQQKFLATARIPSSLASDAASAAIDAEELETAVELLEQGRNMLWSSMGERRLPLDSLCRVNPKLADDLQRLSIELEHLQVASLSESEQLAMESARPMSLAHSEVQTKRYRIVSKEWAEVVKQIREIPGFHDFLQAIPFATLRSAAVEGLSFSLTSAITVLMP